MYMRTSVWKAFLSSVTSAEKSKFNKGVILNTELCFVWSGPICYSSHELYSSSNKEWVTCAKPAKALGTSLEKRRNRKVWRVQTTL